MAFEGSYWQSSCQIAGYIEELVVEGDNKEVSLDLRGTTSERLLKWSSGHRLQRLKVHLCDPRCPSQKVADDYFHGHLVKKIAEDQKQPWMLCLEDGKQDDLKDLRDELGDPAPGRPGLKKGQGSSSTSSQKSAKGKKKKKKKDKKKKPVDAEKVLEEKSRGGGQGDPNPLREPSPQGAGFPSNSVWGDRARPLLGSEKKTQEEGSQGGEEKEEERLKRKYFDLFKWEPKPQHGGHLPRDPSSEECRQEGAWSFGLPVSRGDEGPTDDFKRSDVVPRCGRPSASFGSSLLPKCDEEPYEWRNGQGGLDTLLCNRPGVTREGGRSFGCPPSTLEVFGDDIRRQRLQSISEDRIDPSRDGRGSLHGGTAGGDPGSKGGGQVEVPEWQRGRLAQSRLLERSRERLGQERWQREGWKEGRQESRRSRSKRPKGRRQRKEGGEEKVEDLLKAGEVTSLDGEAWSPSSGRTLGDDDLDVRRCVNDANQCSEVPLAGNLHRRGKAPVTKPEMEVSPGRVLREDWDVGTLEGMNPQMAEKDSHAEADLREPGGDRVEPPESGLEIPSTSSRLNGLSFGRSGPLIAELWTMLESLSLSHCKAQPIGEGIFPLPTVHVKGLEHLLTKYPEAEVVFFNMCRGLNSLAGWGFDTVGKEVSTVQHGALEYLLKQADRVNRWSENFTELSWEKFFQVRGVDYKGDEVLTAHSIEWKNVAPALPLEVGTVDLEEVVNLGTRCYVSNFEEFLVPEEDMVPFRPPKVMVSQEHWE